MEQGRTAAAALQQPAFAAHAAKPVWESLSETPRKLGSNTRLLIACLSLANLCLLNVWAELQESSSRFHRKYTATWSEFAGLLLSILVLAGTFWIVAKTAKRFVSPRTLQMLRWFSPGVLAYPLYLYYLDDAFPFQVLTLPQGIAFRFCLLAVLGGLAGALAVKYGKYSARLLYRVLFMLLPALPIVATTQLWMIASGPSHATLVDQPLAAARPQPPGTPRVVWIIFDEWDYSLSFPHRPANLNLSEIDELRNTSFSARHAYSPTWRTISSVPSMLAGKTFATAKPAGASDMWLTVSGQKAPELLSREPTIFSEAQAQGFNVGIAGWYLPYCRLITGCVSCFWQPAIGLMNRAEYAHDVTTSKYVGSVVKRQLRKIPFLARLASLSGSTSHKELQLNSYAQLHDNAFAVVSDARLNLVYLHWNIPHPYPIYDAKRNAFSSEDGTTYVDNLRLVDQTILELRQTLERAGLWDKTTILFTADHPLRVKTWDPELLLPADPARGNLLEQANEVPFILKMAGQRKGLEYSQEVQTVQTKDLLLAVLGGKVRTAEDVACWLDRHRSPDSTASLIHTGSTVPAQMAAAR